MNGQAEAAWRSESDKPRLRGWLHAAAAVASVPILGWLAWQAAADAAYLVAVLVYAVTSLVLYATSATLHLGNWTGRRYALLLSLDFSNIYLAIAGTYTPFCATLLDGWVRPAVLAVVWGVATLGVVVTARAILMPAWLRTGLYLGMSWPAVLLLPRLQAALPLSALSLMVAGGLLYTLGAFVYALRWPNPLPRIFGFHEVFHLFVIGGWAAFLTVVWVWVTPQ